MRKCTNAQFALGEMDSCDLDDHFLRERLSNGLKCSLQRLLPSLLVIVPTLLVHLSSLFDFRGSIPNKKNLNYSAGLVHNWKTIHGWCQQIQARALYNCS